MLRSADKNLLFIHIQKTGGTSVTQLLQRQIPDLVPFLGKHDPARLAREHLGPAYDAMFKIAFVRNPWDRLVSWYTMIVDNSQRVPREKHNRLWRYVLSRSRNFEEFIVHCTDVIDDEDGQKSFVFNQLDYITDDDGRIIVDFIGRYETLHADTARLLGGLGLTDWLLPHRNPSEHRHYTRYYTDAMRDLVAERFARDIEFFGYRFEPPDR